MQIYKNVSSYGNMNYNLLLGFWVQFGSIGTYFAVHISPPSDTKKGRNHVSGLFSAQTTPNAKRQTKCLRFELCAIWLESVGLFHSCEIKDLESRKSVWGADTWVAAPVFRSGFRFHFWGFWVCALLFTVWSIKCSCWTAGSDCKVAVKD